MSKINVSVEFSISAQAMIALVHSELLKAGKLHPCETHTYHFAENTPTLCPSAVEHLVRQALQEQGITAVQNAREAITPQQEQWISQAIQEALDGVEGEEYEDLCSEQEDKECPCGGSHGWCDHCEGWECENCNACSKCNIHPCFKCGNCACEDCPECGVCMCECDTYCYSCEAHACDECCFCGCYCIDHGCSCKCDCE